MVLIQLIKPEHYELLFFCIYFKSWRIINRPVVVIDAATKESLITGVSSDSLFVKLKDNISIIENFEIQIDLLLSEIKNLLSIGKITTDIIENIELFQSIPSIGD